MNCKECNGPLPEGSAPWRQFCPECYRARRRRKDRQRYEERQAIKAAQQKMKKPIKTLAEVAREAQAHGMSYGQWVARAG